MKAKPARKISFPSQLGAAAGRLSEIGIRTRKDLDTVGPVDAYAMLKTKGHDVNVNLLYRLEAILRGCAPAALPGSVKSQLLASAKSAIKPRCTWAGGDPLMRRYHDEEWGVPVHDDRTLFEFLILEGAQAGLSWMTILRKREHYREAFANFDPVRVARMDARRQAMLMKHGGIVRNRLKIASAVTNARAFLAVQKEFGSFDRYAWKFVGGRAIRNNWTHPREVPVRTAESDALSKDLQSRGFRFVGSTICYAFMQAVGMVNDHLIYCYRHRARASRRG